MADGSQGGLSVARLDTTIAVSLASNCSRGHKNTRYVRKVGWTELGNCDDGYGGWRTDSYKSLLKSQHFDHKSGRFTAPNQGMYFASAMVRLDNAATGIIWDSQGGATKGCIISPLAPKVVGRLS